MPKTDTWMPLYIGDYLADTGHLSTQQHGAYLLLLMYEWRNGPLPDDDKQLANIASCDLATWKKQIAPIVRSFFTPTPDGLSQKRLAAEKREAETHTKKRVEAGKTGAAKRWSVEGKTNGKGNAVANGKGNAVANGKGNAVANGKGNAVANGKPIAKAVPSQWQNDRPSPSPSPSPSPKKLAASCTSQAPLATKLPANPKPSDPPEAWSAFAQEWEVDKRTGINHPIFAGYQLDGLANDVCEAASFGSEWSGDWSTLTGWLTDGIEERQIIGAIRQVASRPNFKTPGVLKYFDKAVREYRIQP